MIRAKPVEQLPGTTIRKCETWKHERLTQLEGTAKPEKTNIQAQKRKMKERAQKEAAYPGLWQDVKHEILKRFTANLYLQSSCLEGRRNLILLLLAVHPTLLFRSKISVCTDEFPQISCAKGLDFPEWKTISPHFCSLRFFSDFEV